MLANNFKNWKVVTRSYAAVVEIVQAACKHRLVSSHLLHLDNRGLTYRAQTSEAMGMESQKEPWRVSSRDCSRRPCCRTMVKLARKLIRGDRGGG